MIGKFFKWVFLGKGFWASFFLKTIIIILFGSIIWLIFLGGEALFKLATPYWNTLEPQTQKGIMIVGFGIAAIWAVISGINETLDDHKKNNPSLPLPDENITEDTKQIKIYLHRVIKRLSLIAFLLVIVLCVFIFFIMQKT
jgi:hypothetical protein